MSVSTAVCTSPCESSSVSRRKVGVRAGKACCRKLSASNVSRDCVDADRPASASDPASSSVRWRFSGSCEAESTSVHSLSRRSTAATSVGSCASRMSASGGEDAAGDVDFDDEDVLAALEGGSSELVSFPPNAFLRLDTPVRGAGLSARGFVTELSLLVGDTGAVSGTAAAASVSHTSFALCSVCLAHERWQPQAWCRAAGRRAG